MTRKPMSMQPLRRRKSAMCKWSAHLFILAPLSLIVNTSTTCVHDEGEGLGVRGARVN